MRRLSNCRLFLSAEYPGKLAKRGAGRRLFYEKNFSRDNTLAFASATIRVSVFTDEETFDRRWRQKSARETRPREM